MGGIVRGLDHTLVGVADLEGARKTWERLGFTACPRGRHIGWGTANYCLMFPRDYIELIGIVDATQFTNNLDTFLETREGLLGLAFATDDMAATVEALRAREIAADGPKDLSRILELPEGEVRPAFKLIFPEPAALPGLRAFVCTHLTPEIVWREAWTRHANTAEAITEAVGVVDDPAGLASAYRRFFGDSAVREAAGGLAVDTGSMTLRFVPPDGLGTVYPELSMPDYPVPWLAGFTVRVGSIDAARRTLVDGGADFLEGQSGGLIVPPESATGVALRFAG